MDRKSASGFRMQRRETPRGLADAFIVGLRIRRVGFRCLGPGDNIFYGHGLPEMLAKAALRKSGATIFGYVVNSPEQYGVVELGSDGRARSIEEKPKQPKSNVL